MDKERMMNGFAKSWKMNLHLALLLALSAPSASAQDKHGNTFGEWAAAWWTTALSTPVQLPSGSHPAFDAGSVDCAIGQDGHVWFLYETIGFAPGAQLQRACTIPTGTALLFPLFNGVYINFASDPPLTRQTCDEIARNDLESLGEVTITALLDGKPLRQNAIQFEQSPIFAVRLPAPTATQTNLLAFFGFPESEFPGWVAAANCDYGWYGYVEPLAVGRHILEWKFESSNLGLLYDMRYELTVAQRNRL